MLLWEKSKDDFRFPFRVYPALKFGPVFVATFDQTCNARSLEEDKYIFGFGHMFSLWKLNQAWKKTEIYFVMCNTRAALGTSIR